MKIELICQCCDKPFETEYKFRDKKFCSRDCYFENVRKGKLKIGRNKDESIREVRLCKVCDKEFEVKKNHNKDEGLPKEIELRKKQYEYYRDMLLTFPKN